MGKEHEASMPSLGMQLSSDIYMFASPVLLGFNGGFIAKAWLIK